MHIATIMLNFVSVWLPLPSPQWCVSEHHKTLHYNLKVYKIIDPTIYKTFCKVLALKNNYLHRSSKGFLERFQTVTTAEAILWERFSRMNMDINF